MSDRDDEPEAVIQVKRWFRRAGGFKTASESDPYSKQQNEVLHQIPKILTVGMALDLVWAMDAHHRETLTGGASLNKALAIIRSPLSRFPVSETSLRSTWSCYKPAAHLCAGFAVAYRQAREGDSGEIDERMKNAYVEQLHVMVSLIAAYQRFATGFIPHGQRRPLIGPKEMWLLRGIEGDRSFVPRPCNQSCSPWPKRTERRGIPPEVRLLQRRFAAVARVSHLSENSSHPARLPRVAEERRNDRCQQRRGRDELRESERFTAHRWISHPGAATAKSRGLAETSPTSRSERLSR